MAWKVITFLAIFALSEARPPKSEQWVKKEDWLSQIGSQQSEHHEEYASAYPAYEFTYEVSDPHTHDFKSHHEQRKGDDVKGYYWLIQPDGLKRTVKYHVDKHSGFKAHVDYKKHGEGENSRQEGEANEEENNAGENENSEENENGQENEGAVRNENEAEGEEETESNESGAGEGEENQEEQGETEEAENQEGEESEQQEEQWGWIRGRIPIARRYNRKGENEKNERELKATVGIWQPISWSKRVHNEERQVRSGEENENRSRGESGNEKRRNKSKNEERRQETENNENNEQNEANREEQSNEGNENVEGRNESHHKGEVIKSEYRVVIHHPKPK